ncbi:MULTISPECIES: HAD family hydrolase [unclassified Streptomyces]|uniref:HAD family hydrolase n=1 Tax=Streptomyces sp. NPDC005955 TaxID=3364738 RepID=UPI00367EC770
MGKQSAHIVWDWNGTLFHDIEAVVAASNAAFAQFGLGPITVEQYRELYCVPIPRFYERLMGRVPTQSEWLTMDEAFQRHYAGHMAGCALTEGAEELLSGWRAAGRSQSLLSMYGHAELVPLVQGFGIDAWFTRVDGRVGPSGVSKSEAMTRHLAALGEVPASRVVVIGDAADDAVAARAAGAEAVLYTGGAHSRVRLEAMGVPVVDSLTEAVAVAERML